MPANLGIDLFALLKLLIPPLTSYVNELIRSGTWQCYRVWIRVPRGMPSITARVDFHGQTVTA